MFLRVLEYYNGVLFLTTNRIGDFDEVFASRVHVSLYYPHLDLQSTPKIFELNLERIGKKSQEKNRAITIDQEKIMQFIHLHWESKDRMRWNGRQIRNGCQTALALAEFEAQGGNLERVVDAIAEVKLLTSISEPFPSRTGSLTITSKEFTTVIWTEGPSTWASAHEILELHQALLVLKSKVYSAKNPMMTWEKLLRACSDTSVTRVYPVFRPILKGFNHIYSIPKTRQYYGQPHPPAHSQIQGDSNT